MSNYCDFNPKLFKEFTSMYVKIKPTLSDDWEMIPDTYSQYNSFKLYSKKINQTIADIPLYRFLEFSKKFNLTIEALKLKGTFIVGNDRSVYTEEMYNNWVSKYEKRTEVITDVKDAKIGYSYKTPCGKTVVFLGFRYVSLIKTNNTDSAMVEKLNHTKITKKAYVCDKDGSYVQEFKGKLTEEISKQFSPERADEILQKYFEKNINISCFEKEKPKTKEPIYELISFEPKATVDCVNCYAMKTEFGIIAKLYNKGDYVYFAEDFVRGLKMDKWDRERYDSSDAKSIRTKYFAFFIRDEVQNIENGKEFTINNYDNSKLPRGGYVEVSEIYRVYIKKD